MSDTCSTTDSASESSLRLLSYRIQRELEREVPIQIGTPASPIYSQSAFTVLPLDSDHNFVQIRVTLNK